jgi:short-subunit dehydrogenase
MGRFETGSSQLHGFVSPGGRWVLTIRPEEKMMSKSILITGASSGIGKALAYELAGRGYRLGLTARRIDLLEEIRKDIQSKGSASALAVRALDVTDYAAVPDTIQAMAEALNGLDIVFANAGIGLGEKIGRGRFDATRQTVEVNLLGAMATVDGAVAYFLQKGGGHVVGTISVAALRGTPRNASNSASKAGLAMYLETLRAEVYRKHIDVTVLYPGYIDTPLNRMLPRRPFVISAAEAARIIARHIEKKTRKAFVPALPWRFLGPMLKFLPTGLVARM